MALTYKAISTISYNSKEFLKNKLDAMLEAEIISFYAYVPHKGENGDKDHIHLYIEPNKRLETMKLQKEFNEADPTSEKPLGVMRFQRSKLDDWTMYSIHEESYLKIKGETREEHYSIDDVVTSEKELIRQVIDDWNSIPHFANKNQEIAYYLTLNNLSTYQVALATGYKVMEIEAIRKAMINEQAMEQKNQYEESVKQRIEDRMANNEQNVVEVEKYEDVQEGELKPTDVVKVMYIDPETNRLKHKLMIIDKNGELVEQPKEDYRSQFKEALGDDDLPF